MSEQRQQHRFVAVLVFDDEHGRRTIAPRVYEASHPEIAYQLALAGAQEQHFGLTFVGLAHLGTVDDDEDVPPIAKSEAGDARELVVDRHQLEAFQDLRWAGVAHDPHELNAALTEPPLLFELDGLNDIRWSELRHAYGPAMDVPSDLRRLASSDEETRQAALWQLSGSIYHQGDVYNATAAAVPFLLRVLEDSRAPNRADVGELLVEITESSWRHPNRIRAKWEKLRELFHGDDAFVAEHTAGEVSSILAVRQALVDLRARIERLKADPSPEVQGQAQAILEKLDNPDDGRILCTYCRGSGECRCRRWKEPTEQCRRCGGSGKCHVCKGKGEMENTSQS